MLINSAPAGLIWLERCRVRAGTNVRMTLVLRLHDNLRGSLAILGTFVPKPGMWSSSREPEVGFAKEGPEHTECAEFRNEFDLVSFELPGGSPDPLFAAQLEGDLVKLRIIREHVSCEGSPVFERKELKNPGDTFNC